MTKIYIDGQEIGSTTQSAVTLSFDADDMQDIEQAREAKDVTISIVANADNVAIFGGEGLLHAKERFNAEAHSAVITYEEEVVVEGSVTLTSVERDGNAIAYTLKVRRSGADWAHNVATTMLNSSKVNFDMLLTLDEIKEAWETDVPVKFVPVYWDTYVDDNPSVTEGDIITMRAINDYHPFLKIKSIVESIFNASEYTVVSKFMESNLFDQLYMSGGYSSQGNAAASDAMNFLVKKISDNSATANSFGRVYLTPHTKINCVDNIVDIESLTQNAECFTRNDCFTVDGDTLKFVPTTSVSVGFEVKLNYLSDYYIESRDKLQAFDTIYLYDGNLTQLTVVNQFDDLRKVVTKSDFSYRAIVFDGGEDDCFQVVGDADGWTTPYVVGEWTGRSGIITTPTSSVAVLDECHLRKLVDGSYVDCDLDWALYYGHVEERGETQITITIQTTPKTITPDASMEFVGMYIQGAEVGANFTLLSGGYIKPIFATRPYDSTWIEFSDVAQLDYNQLDLLNAIQQMFNLRLYTDTIGRQIYIEPSEEIYGAEDTWDWSAKIDHSQAITFEDRAHDLHMQRTWGYQDGDGLIKRYSTDYAVPGTTLPAAPESDPQQSVEGSTSPEFGAWSIPTYSEATTQSTNTILNEIFSPSLNDLNGVLIVGDRDDTENVGTYHFEPRIVRWLGMIESNNEQMPYVAFHSTSGEDPDNPDDGVTLCFEDRDGITGLNQYYRDEVLRDSSAQYVTLTLRMTTHEMIMLLSPTPGAPSVLSTFRLMIDGEWAICRLHSISKFTLGDEAVNCRFLIVG